MNHFAIARDAILRKRFGLTEPDAFAIPVVGEDVEYGELKETRESKAERKATVSERIR